MSTAVQAPRLTLTGLHLRAERDPYGADIADDGTPFETFDVFRRTDRIATVVVYANGDVIAWDRIRYEHDQQRNLRNIEARERLAAHLRQHYTPSSLSSWQYL